VLLRRELCVRRCLQVLAELRLRGEVPDMKPELKAAFAAELQHAREAARGGDRRRAWHHLERAHVLSQAYAWPHVHVHALMLGAGLRRGDVREVLGQLVRALVAAPGSWLGRAPLGNTGGADVGMLTPMPIAEDLRRLL
jgi:Protein of unknown function (DUF3703)